jgi:hypothetical protein
VRLQASLRRFTRMTYQALCRKHRLDVFYEINLSLQKTRADQQTGETAISHVKGTFTSLPSLDTPFSP